MLDFSLIYSVCKQFLDTCVLRSHCNIVVAMEAVATTFFLPLFCLHVELTPQTPTTINSDFNFYQLKMKLCTIRACGFVPLFPRDHMCTESRKIIIGKCWLNNCLRRTLDSRFVQNMIWDTIFLLFSFHLWFTSNQQ